MTKIATVLFSGGVDSTCCMHILAAAGYRLFPVFVDFGQPAAAIEWANVQTLSAAFGTSPQQVVTSSKQAFGAGEIRGRNAFLLTTALVFTAAQSGVLVMGLHAGSPYYDCSPEFVDRMDSLLGELSGGNFALSAPLLEWSKRDIYAYFRATELDPDLTYSCESGVIGGCGTCLSCQDRGLL